MRLKYFIPLLDWPSLFCHHPEWNIKNHLRKEEVKAGGGVTEKAEIKTYAGNSAVDLCSILAL